mmetsp:Transcript_18725/g.30673  ORF Transcript_18725/g.30673 Transcript_18725/m.30673 type:complete len:212 (-) Transcript_18725:194-829(-)
MMVDRIILLGDSDVSRWPSSLYPGERCVNIAKGGAVISDMQCQLNDWRDFDERDDESNTLFVACAGENDVSSGQPIDRIQTAFASFLVELFGHKQIITQQQSKHLIFFGPKFEPWLTEDYASRKQYTKLSNALQRTIRKIQVSLKENIVYVDCLTMFCTNETKDIPGAIHGGRALPNRTYFDSDELHLSEQGYKVWRDIVKEEIERINRVT